VIFIIAVGVSTLPLPNTMKLLARSTAYITVPTGAGPSGV
jgi:hypothetical protein